MTRDANKNPEQIARDRIDGRLRAAGWDVQGRNAIDFNAELGIAVREYQADVGPADYLLFADRRPVGVVEAKPDRWGARLTTVEEQSEGYAKAKLRWVSNAEPLPFLYEATGQVTRFTNGRDPNPRSREVFAFHRPETLKDWKLRSFRSGLASLPPLHELTKNVGIKLPEYLGSQQPDEGASGKAPEADPEPDSDQEP